MKTVILYPGTGRFSGKASFNWASPTLGSTHRFILLLSQSDSVPDHNPAEREVESYGFSEIELGEGRKIDVETMNDPNMAAFRRHYEGAFAEKLARLVPVTINVRLRSKAYCRAPACHAAMANLIVAGACFDTIRRGLESTHCSQEQHVEKRPVSQKRP